MNLSLEDLTSPLCLTSDKICSITYLQDMLFNLRIAAQLRALTGYLILALAFVLKALTLIRLAVVI